MQAALNAKQELAEEYPDAVIEVMDSQLVTVLQGMLVKEAVKLRNQGRSLEEAMEALARGRTAEEVEQLRRSEAPVIFFLQRKI